MKIPVIAIAGPTASGKTLLAINLCESLSGEVVSADSMQIYKGLDIGTAKPTKTEQKRVRHHMIDVCSIEENYNVKDYVRDAKKALTKVWERGKIPVIAGGTGLYLDSLVYDYSYSDAIEDLSLRKELSLLSENEGNEAVHSILKELDPKAASSIHSNNLKRVIRAIEIIKSTGKSLEESIKREEKEAPYDFLYAVLMPEREYLYERIDQRVDKMIKEGLYEEATWLFENIKDKNATCMQAIGYKEFLPVYEGKMDLESAVEQLKKNTRHYAKRQITWFKKNKDAVILKTEDDIKAFKKEAEERFGQLARK